MAGKTVPKQVRVDRLRNTLAIAGKELRGYLGTPSFYSIIAVFLFVSGYGFGWSPATYQESTIRGFLDWSGFFLLSVR